MPVDHYWTVAQGKLGMPTSGAQQRSDEVLRDEPAHGRSDTLIRRCRDSIPFDTAVQLQHGETFRSFLRSRIHEHPAPERPKDPRSPRVALDFRTLLCASSSHSSIIPATRDPPSTIHPRIILTMYDHAAAAQFSSMSLTSPPSLRPEFTILEAVVSGSGTTFIVVLRLQRQVTHRVCRRLPKSQNLYDIHKPTVALFLQFVSIEVLAPFVDKMTESSSYVSGVDVLLGFSGFLMPISHGVWVSASFSSAPLPPASPSANSAFPTRITAGGATSHSQDIVSFYCQHRHILYQFRRGLCAHYSQVFFLHRSGIGWTWHRSTCRRRLKARAHSEPQPHIDVIGCWSL